MNIEQVRELLEAIAPGDDKEHRWIDCSESTGYTDNNQYERIVAAIKQNIELQTTNYLLTGELEEVKRNLENTQFDKEQQIKLNKGIDDMYVKALNCLKKAILLANESLPKEQPLVRIDDYEITYIEDDIELAYKPLPVGKQVTLEIQVIEEEKPSDLYLKCPICNKKLEQHPAISRKDDTTLICSKCALEEALKAWEESLKDDKKDI